MPQATSKSSCVCVCVQRNAKGNKFPHEVCVCVCPVLMTKCLGISLNPSCAVFVLMCVPSYPNPSSPPQLPRYASCPSGITCIVCMEAGTGTKHWKALDLQWTMVEPAHPGRPTQNLQRYSIRVQRVSFTEQNSWACCLVTGPHLPRQAIG